MKAVFIRALSYDDKAAALRGSVSRSNSELTRRYEVDPVAFAQVSRSPFTYWASPSLRRLFVELAAFEVDRRTARLGASSKNDFRFVRIVGETRFEDPAIRWKIFAKGGTHAPYYSDLYLTILWLRDARELEAELLKKYPYLGDNADFVLHRGHPHLRPGLTWPARSQRGLSTRALPADCIFGHKGPAAFIKDDQSRGLLALLAVMNGLVFRGLVDLQMAFGSFEVGVIQRTPVPDLTPADETALAKLARRAWSLKRSLDTRTETSHAFVLPALLQVEGATLAGRAIAWEARVRTAEAELAAIQAEIDDRCFELYGIGEEDRRSITEGFGGSPAAVEEGAEVADAEAEDEEEDEAETADTATLAAELVSWAAGVAFGRFDVRLATGERELLGEPEPFDPLPVCSPGMLTGADGLPLAVPPAGYRLAFPADGILVDDPGHPLDLVAAVRAVFEVVFGQAADARWQEAAALLDPKSHDLRTWFRSSFFEHHLHRHSKSRRKAPILWQLGAPSGRYAAWCYAHRLTPDSLFALGRDLVAPKLALEERRRTSLVQDAGTNPTAKQRADIAAQETIVEELRAFADEVRRVAPLWSPDLDDGIVLVSAPLWRLVPHKSWQKELRSRWDDLAVGKYDWAHLSMHLWPERVVPKCADDRSLAIAHGLEEVFWVEGTEGKWTRRSHPTTSIDDLIAERTSPAVKAALTELLAAPAPAGARTRGRAGE